MISQRLLPIAVLLLPSLWAGLAAATDNAVITVSSPPGIATSSTAGAPALPANNAPKASSSGFLTLPSGIKAKPPAAPTDAPSAIQSTDVPPVDSATQGSLSLPPTSDAPSEEPSDLPGELPGNVPPATAPSKADSAKAPDAVAAATVPSEENAPPVDDTQPEPNSIVLQGLNKVTGHISRLEAPVGTVMRFGTLEIIGRRCWKSPPDEQPENAGLLEIWELRPGESHQRIFLGWIFSSSPGLSGLEHPVYDVTMLECLYVNPNKAETPDKDKTPDAKDAKGDKPADKGAKPTAKPAAKTSAKKVLPKPTN